MTNNSSTGGYLAPTYPALPDGLTLDQFVNTIIAGMTGLAGQNVRPRFQQNPPKTPDVDFNWCAFKNQNFLTDANAYVEVMDDATTKLVEHEQFDIFCSFYGPLAEDLARAFRTGFQISQNREPMFKANMGFKGHSAIIPADELINERWFQRRDVTVTIVRQIQPLYEILSFESATGIIVTDNNPQLTATFDTDEAKVGGFSEGYYQPSFG